MPLFCGLSDNKRDDQNTSAGLSELSWILLCYFPAPSWVCNIEERLAWTLGITESPLYRPRKGALLLLWVEQDLCLTGQPVWSLSVTAGALIALNLLLVASPGYPSHLDTPADPGATRILVPPVHSILYQFEGSSPSLLRSLLQA